MEEQLARSAVRLSDALELAAPRQAVIEVVLLAMPDDQLDSVSSVLSSPADVLGFHDVRRMPYGPDLLHQIVQDGLLGNLDGLGFLGQARRVHMTTSEVPISNVPLPKALAKEMPIVGRRGRGTGIRGRAPRRHSKPSEPEVLRSLLTTLTEQIESMECRSSGPRPDSNGQYFRTSPPLGLLGIPAKAPASAGCGRARGLFGIARREPLSAQPHTGSDRDSPRDMRWNDRGQLWQRCQTGWSRGAPPPSPCSSRVRREEGFESLAGSRSRQGSRVQRRGPRRREGQNQRRRAPVPINSTHPTTNELNQKLCSSTSGVVGEPFSTPSSSCRIAASSRSSANRLSICVPSGNLVNAAAH